MAWMTGALDLNGDTRISAATVDMGAYEYIATPLSPALSSPARLSANQFQFVLSGTAGQTYTVEYSLTLTNWLSLLVTNAPGNPFITTDSTATNQLRFYRVRAGP
ncbi:MAG TPA: hypothetical protein VG146_00335 [Verrucomicrobiae bacterium]|nr:hypothetical protein [Verrucomicrobiae bacterium]